MPLASGTRLGPYEIVEPLGKGAMGEVYRARDQRLGRDVAIKVLPEHTASSPDALARFEFEARAVAALNHPNILAIHDVGSTAGGSFAVMELLEGETLRERLAREGRLPPRKALDIAVQLARGLAAAHARGIVHRDLKPSNVFLTSDGRLKILDFGVAVHEATSHAASVADTRSALDAGMIVGTIGYMAPEQVRGESASVRSDVFSYGLVVYETLTGTNPFQRATLPETMAAILRDQPDALTSIPGMPTPAARLIDRCLEKLPDDRPQSLRDIAIFLESFSSPGTDWTVSDNSAAKDLRPFIRQTVLAACALLLLVTATTWAYVRARGNRTVDAVLSADLGRAESLVFRAQQERLDRLRLSARLVASFPELKALFETDAPTIRDFLQNYQQRNPGTPVLIALGPEGYVLAGAGDDAAAAVPESGPEWLGALRAAGDTRIIAMNGRPYHAAVASAEAGGTIFGAVMAAAPVDSRFAQVLREVTEDDAVLLDERAVTGTSLRAGQVPWTSLADFRSRRGSGASPTEVTIDGTRFSAREVVLTKEPPVSAVLLASRDDVTGPYRGIQSGVLLIGLAACALTLLAGVLAIRNYRL